MMEVLVWLEVQASKNPILSILLPVIGLLWVLGGVKERQDLPADVTGDYYKGQAQVWREVAMMLFAEEESPQNILKELNARKESGHEISDKETDGIDVDSDDGAILVLDTSTG